MAWFVQVLLINSLLILNWTTTNARPLLRLTRQLPPQFLFHTGPNTFPAPVSFFNQYLPFINNPSNVNSLQTSSITSASNGHIQQINIPAGSTMYILEGSGTKLSAPENPSMVSGLFHFGPKPSTSLNSGNNQNLLPSMFANNFPGYFQNIPPLLPPPPFSPNTLYSWLNKNPSTQPTPPPPTSLNPKLPESSVQNMLSPILSQPPKVLNTAPVLSVPTTTTPVSTPSISNISLAPEYNMTICEKETKTMACKDNKRLKIFAATFGRQMWYICDPTQNIRLTNQCVGGNTLENVLGQCQGKPSCTLTADVQLGGGIDPCPGISKYLTVLYDCK